MKIRNILLSLLVPILVTSAGTHEGYTQMSEKRFIGFPHRGMFLQMVPADEPDTKAAKKHFEALFLGKDVKFVQTVCRDEKEMEEKGQHDAQLIYCEEKKAENRFEISYRFGVKDKQGEPMPIALVWDIDLGLKDGIVNSVDPRVRILTP